MPPRRYSLGLTHMLTDTKLRGLKPKAKVYRVADTNGLCIEVLNLPPSTGRQEAQGQAACFSFLA